MKLKNFKKKIKSASLLLQKITKDKRDKNQRICKVVSTCTLVDYDNT